MNMEIREAILPVDKRDLNDISPEECEKLTWRISQTSVGTDEPMVLRAMANGDHKLNKILKACKEDGRDIYKAVASAIYDTPYEAVTLEQRVNAKERLMHTLYSRSDKTLEELLSEKD